ncbi:MAG: BON domain-containing protein [Nitrospira sp. CR1.2]|nr:BON domain-containing protein [Nitrospira sp. CR1.2]
MRLFHRLLLPLLLLGLSAGCLLPASSTLPDTPKDAVISTNVEAKFAEDRQGGLSGIIVTTEGGTVTLTGTVQRAERKARAAELARQVTGVRRVKNDLEIRATPAP